MTLNEPSMAFGDAWWSTIAVVPRSSASRAPEHRRPPDHLEIERTVEAPPDELEDLFEVVRRPRGGRHPPGERRVEMMVAADETPRHAWL